MKQIEFPSKIENLALVESFIDEICEAFKVDQDNYGNILIAVTEAVNNAIQHGNKNEPSKNVTVSCDEKEKNVITFSVSDEGPGFDFDNLPDPTDPENLEKPHGRGVFLMKQLSDEVEFFDDGRKVEISFGS